MALPQEPKNGDFASYVEALSRGGGRAPGEVGAPTRAPGAKGWGRSAPAGETGDPWTPLPGRSTTPHIPAQAQHPAPGPQASPAFEPPWSGNTAPDAAPQPLAARGAQRRISVIMALVSLVVAWVALGRLVEAINHRPFAFENLIPGLFLAAFAFMIYKASRQSRNKAARGELPRYGKLDSLSGKPRTGGNKR